MSQENVFAWLIPHCPNFYFMPSLCYHQVFKEWDDDTWNCPAYWSSIGIPIIPCYLESDEKLSQLWISKNKHSKWESTAYLKQPGQECSLWKEALDCSRRCSQVTETLKFELSLPLQHGPIIGELSSWRRKLSSGSPFRYKHSE